MKINQKQTFQYILNKIFPVFFYFLLIFKYQKPWYFDEFVLQIVVYLEIKSKTFLEKFIKCA